MAKKARRNSGGNDGPDLGAKLDAVVDLLQDLFILQAMSLGARREDIRAMLGAHTTRISKINKGIKEALKSGKTKGAAQND
jgi:hypothetical protein